MIDLLRSIISAPGFKVPAALRSKVIKAVLALVVALLGAITYRLSHQAALPVAADQPGWEGAVLATTISFRTWVALGLAAACVVLAVLAFQLFDRSALGQRLFHWDTAKDSGYTEASKTLSAGAVFAALLLGLFILAGAVLR